MRGARTPRGPVSGLKIAAAVVVALTAGASVAGASGTPARARLTVCADPNNLPFSNRERAGFENKIAALLARDLGAGVDYVWWAQRRGYVRSTLNESKCDLWPGVATGTERVESTRPYYRSTYVFVTRAASPLAHLTLDDPRLRHAVIGVQMIGNDSMNSPPAHALAARGITGNVRGFMLYGDYARPNPPAAIVDAVARGRIDVALVWGPLAGYFGNRSQPPLRIEPVAPADEPPWRMTFDISMGVRRGDAALLDAVNAALERERAAIRRVLTAYHVPLEPQAPSQAQAEAANGRGPGTGPSGSPAAAPSAGPSAGPGMH